jgi:hypothetical protein
LDSWLGRGIFLLSVTSIPALGLTQPPIHWLPEDVSPEVKRPEREADHSPPSIAAVKNSGAIYSLRHTCKWHGA